jgi:LmbE family N-acetylglucosaminyl deacetylase
MHIGVLRKYENDVNIPGGDALVSIGKTGVNLHWLLMGEGEMEVAGNGDDPSVPSQTLLHSRLKEAQRLLEVLDEDRQLTVLDDIFMRVKEAKRVTDLERVVRELSRKLG